MLAFLETGAFVGFVAPGETAVIVGGLVAGQGEISLLVLIAIVWACAVRGDLTSFVLGRRLGRGWLLRHGERLKITEERLQQVEGFFERRGGATILVGRFIGFVRPLAPFLAGAARMPLRRFLPYDVLGAGAWTATFATLGYVFWQSFDKLTHVRLARAVRVRHASSWSSAALVWLVRLRRDPERARAGAARGCDERARPAAAGARSSELAGPLWRCVGARRPAAPTSPRASAWHRLTPGRARARADDAARAAGRRRLHVLFLGEIAFEPPACRTSTAWPSDLAERRRRSTRSSTSPRSSPTSARWPVVAPIVAITASGRRCGGAGSTPSRWSSGMGLLGRSPCTSPRRPTTATRPSGGLVDADLTRLSLGPHRLRGRRWSPARPCSSAPGVGWAVRFAAVTVAWWSSWWSARRRVYLRVHYLTDVIGGAALGVAIWALVGVVALVAGYVRQNGGRAAMIDDRVTQIVIGVAALVSLVAWLTLIAVPAWRSYWRLRERVLALVMSVYVLAAFVRPGALAGGLVLWYYDRL